MTYSVNEVQYILNLFYFFQKNKYNSVKIRENMKTIFGAGIFSFLYTF